MQSQNVLEVNLKGNFILIYMYSLSMNQI